MVNAGPTGTLTLLLVRLSELGAYVPELHLRPDDYAQIEKEMTAAGVPPVGPGQFLAIVTAAGVTRLVAMRVTQTARLQLVQTDPETVN